jgi:hypothetical protein
VCRTAPTVQGCNPTSVQRMQVLFTHSQSTLHLRMHGPDSADGFGGNSTMTIGREGCSFLPDCITQVVLSPYATQR